MFRFGAREKSYAPFLCIFRFSPHREPEKKTSAPQNGSKMNANHAQNDWCTESGLVDPPRCPLGTP